MTDPFYKAIPGGPIIADDWNNMQVKMRDELSARISAHTHTGATEGKKLTGDGIDPTSVLKVNQLDAAVSLSVKNIDVLGRLNTLDAQKLALTGGNITGALSVSGALGLGTTSPNKKLTVDYTGSTANYANMELRQPGNVSWGVALVVRTTGGVDGASILLRSRTKNWQLRGETGATATGFQLTEDGGDAEYGSGVGTPRLHVSAGGAVGIGTTAPGAKLHVIGATKDTTASALRLASSDGSNLLEVRNDGFISIFDKTLYLRAMGDAFHGINYNGTVDGPSVFGNSGGQLASGGGSKVALKWSGTTVTALGDFYAGNSSVYFTQTEHNHSGIGNTMGYAAIENAKDYGALMILGRQTTDKGRVVKLWDRLEINGKLWTTDGRFEGSDLRLKRDITPLEGALEKVLKLRGTRFRMVESKDQSLQIGLIAQEVEELFPEVIDEGPNGMKGISYARLVAPLIEAIKSQQQQLDELRSALRTATKENLT
ncbi:tail fiber domain-containing protein [Archangium sp.]|uniref:tail fiber domain-containing protein n=1 Tax=Archangium sp. TaxID=1872627 RepID=UPI00286B4E87|nr:tail fiber domain-containing protein [Archangium sp.]